MGGNTKIQVRRPIWEALAVTQKRNGGGLDQSGSSRSTVM